MNYILFNADGSVKKTNFTDIITQNSNEENQIFISVKDLDINEHEAFGIFVLPDKSASVEVGTPENDVEYAEDEFANGYVITLTNAETVLPGLVHLTIQIKNSSSQKVLYTYRVPLTINETADLETYVNITLAQYNNLVDYINTIISNINDRVPYIGATGTVNLGENILIAEQITATGSLDVTSSNRLYEDSGDLIIESDDGDIELSPSDKATYNGKEIATKDDLPKRNLIAQFSTNLFTQTGSGNYVAEDVPIHNFIEGSDIIVITWDNCFAICPIPATPEADGRVVAAMWNANGEAQTIRIRYAVTDGNSLLQISLQGGFTPPTGHTVYVFCYKIV